jgi:hypothetical protein
MGTDAIELEGFEIELASDLYCDRGGDHHELVVRARADRRRLGHNVYEVSGCVCPVHESNSGSSSGRTLDFESGYGRSNRSPAASLET